jgi:hypothetical protein
VCTTQCQEEAFAIAATQRDPYYSDELAVALNSGTTVDTVRITLDRNIPLIRPLNFRSSLLQGEDGVPTNIRADIEQMALERMPVNMYSTIPKGIPGRRDVAMVDRYNNRWVIVSSPFVPDISTDVACGQSMTTADDGTQSVLVDGGWKIDPAASRTSPSHQVRGRGACPWWRTGFPDGISTTGVA